MLTLGMPILHLVDAFATGPFSGNPAAVCVLDAPADPDWMQRIAFELGYSETAFLVARGDEWGLRWFTPTVEVALCGHATLASAHVLWSLGHATQSLRFHTQSGVLTCERAGELIRMSFPRVELTESTPPDGMIEALGIKPVSVWRARWDYLVELTDEAQVRAVQPDFRALRKIEVRGVSVTARSSDPAFDFVSRFFAPGSGVDEDPATGSAHCALTPFWAERLDKKQLRAFQASPRGGYLELELKGDRVSLAGRAFTTLRGELTV